MAIHVELRLPGAIVEVSWSPAGAHAFADYDGWGRGSSTYFAAPSTKRVTTCASTPRNARSTARANSADPSSTPITYRLVHPLAGRRPLADRAEDDLVVARRGDIPDRRWLNTDRDVHPRLSSSVIVELLGRCGSEGSCDFEASFSTCRRVSSRSRVESKGLPTTAQTVWSPRDLRCDAPEEALDQRPSVTLGVDALVQNRDDAGVLPRADQTSEALLQR